jgi:hypothetical protein
MSYEERRKKHLKKIARYERRPVQLSGSCSLFLFRDNLAQMLFDQVHQLDVATGRSPTDVLVHVMAHYFNNFHFHITSSFQKGNSPNVISFCTHFVHGIDHWGGQHKYCVRKECVSFAKWPIIGIPPGSFRTSDSIFSYV